MLRSNFCTQSFQFSLIIYLPQKTGTVPDDQHVTASRPCDSGISTVYEVHWLHRLETSPTPTGSSCFGSLLPGLVVWSVNKCFRSLLNSPAAPGRLIWKSCSSGCKILHTKQTETLCDPAQVTASSKVDHYQSVNVAVGGTPCLRGKPWRKEEKKLLTFSNFFT